MKGSYDGRRIWFVEARSRLSGKYEPLVHMHEVPVFFNRRLAEDWVRENKTQLLSYIVFQLYDRVRVVQYVRSGT